MDTMAAEKEITSVEDADMVFIRNTYFKYKEESFFWRYWHWILIGFVSGVFVFLVAGCTIESHLRKALLQAQQHGTKEVDPLSFSPCGNYTTRARCSNGNTLISAESRLTFYCSFVFFWRPAAGRKAPVEMNGRCGTISDGLTMMMMFF